MRKRNDKKKFDISWKLYSLVLISIFLLATLGFTYAYEGGDATVMGHSAGEFLVSVDVDGELTEMSLQDAIEGNYLF